MYNLKLSLIIWKTNFNIQKIDRSTIIIYKISLTSFLLQNQIEQAL